MSVRNMDRRRFLQMASAGAMAGTGLATTSFAAPTSRNPPVIIIGAGMSGVSAAYWLSQLGIPSIILEGRNRLGGRINSSSFWPDAILDVGAAWIHDSLNSPLTPLTKTFNIGTYETVFFPPSWFGLQNQLLGLPSIANFALQYADVIDKVQCITNTLFNKGVPDQPLANVVNEVLNSQVWDPEVLAGVQTVMDADIRIRYGASLENLSLYYYNKDQNVIQVHDLAFPKGYVQLVNALAQAAGQPIHLNCIVQQINYDTKGVTVITNQGTFTGQYVILTLPVGVLQKCQGPSPLVQFNPPLPDWKLEAINHLGMGRFDKFALRFPVNFWGQNQILHNRPQTQISQFTIWFNPVLMFAQQNGGRPVPPVLVPVVFGDFAKQLETVPDNQVQSTIMNLLKPWFAAQNIQVPDPIQRGFQRSNWGSDPFAYGSTSTIPTGATPVDRFTLSLPVSPGASPTQRLFFAGEATDGDHPGAVWGAYVSGMREAYRLSLLSPNRSRTTGSRGLAAGKFTPALIWRAYNAQMKEAYRKAKKAPIRGKESKSPS